MRQILTADQITADTDRWLQARRSLITGTDVASIMRVKGAFSGPPQVYYDKTQGEARPDKLRWRVGRHNETLIHELYAEANPADIVEPAGLFTDDDQQWIGCTFDRLATTRKLGVVPLEFKTDGARRGRPDAEGNRSGGWGDPPYGDIPPQYLAQAIWEGFIAGAVMVKVPVLFLPGGPFLVFFIEMDASAMADAEAMIAAAHEFKTTYIDAGRPPPADWLESTEAVLKRVYRDAEVGQQVTIPWRLRDRLFAADRAVKAAERRKQQAVNEVRERLGAATIAVDPRGNTVAQRILSWPSKISPAIIRNDYPDVAAAATVTRDLDNPVDALRLNRPEDGDDGR